MLTRMTDTDWKIVLEAFRAARSRRGEKGRDDRKFLEALHYFSVHNITWRSVAGGIWQMEQRLEAGVAAEPGRRIRGVARQFGRIERHRSPRSDGRFDDCARPCLGSRRKRGQEGQALGRPRGGGSTKNHRNTDIHG